MNKWTITGGNNGIILGVNQIKYILGTNYPYKHAIKQTIKQYFSKSVSEWREEYPQSQAKILFNDKELNRKRTLFLQITPDYSLSEDLKLTTKSLIYQYLEVKLQDAKFFDTINTLDILFQAFADELAENDDYYPNFSTMSIKQLIKLMNPVYKDDYQKDEFDLSYEETILLQIKLIQYISDRNRSMDHVYILADIPQMTTPIMQKLQDCTKCTLFIFSNNYHPLMKYNEICVLEDLILDLANEEDVYYKINDKSYQPLFIEEVKLKVIHYITNKYTIPSSDLVNSIIHFSK